MSITWTLVAISAMLVANRQRERELWYGGTGLLLVVMVKLFLVDLAQVGTIERIVSFVGVGALMLLVGYFSPLPPRAVDATHQEIAP